MQKLPAVADPCIHRYPAGPTFWSPAASPFRPGAPPLNEGWGAYRECDIAALNRALYETTSAIGRLADDLERARAQRAAAVNVSSAVARARGSSAPLATVAVPTAPKRLDPEVLIEEDELFFDTRHVVTQTFRETDVLPEPTGPSETPCTFDVPTTVVPPVLPTPVVPEGQEWPRPDDPLADVGPVVAAAVRSGLRFIEETPVGAGALRTWVVATGPRRYPDPVVRLERLAVIARKVPRPFGIQPLTDDLFAAAGAWVTEIDGGSALAHARALAAVDAIAASGIDPDGRLFVGAGEAWRARAGMTALRGCGELLEASARRMIAALGRGQSSQARMSAHVVRALVRSVYPDPYLRIGWLARSVGRPRLASQVDMSPVRELLTAEVSESFGALPGLPLTRVVDLFLGCAMADLESCMDGAVFDRCMRALLVDLGCPPEELVSFPRVPLAPVVETPPQASGLPALEPAGDDHREGEAPRERSLRGRADGATAAHGRCSFTRWECRGSDRGWAVALRVGAACARSRDARSDRRVFETAELDSVGPSAALWMRSGPGTRHLGASDGFWKERRGRG